MDYKALNKAIQSQLEQMEEESKSLPLTEKHLYYYIWVSEFLFLRSITKQLNLMSKYPYWLDDQFSEYYNIKNMDFTKLKS